jgi:hypothetical protein
MKRLLIEIFDLSWLWEWDGSPPAAIEVRRSVDKMDAIRRDRRHPNWIRVEADRLMLFLEGALFDRRAGEA